MNRALVQKVLRTIKQRTNLLVIDDVLLGTTRLEARAPLHGVTLNVPGIAVYLSGYAIERVNGNDEDRDPEFEASTDNESGTVWEVADRLLGLNPADTDALFGFPSSRAVLAALEQLAAGADQVNWSAIR
ncbi:hypothetical protein OG413_40105 [Streptomyces sp. NBC_01433]|jgi:hypothetical protein|uniref:hypothetical protein n=1 Tax=Streptomyces sp. NBC_01433 TaxID=2903864 RepID=UPI0022561857|nr:hypothetical protein [Streptomyces sp. NBC_01433]MCX4681403.1 hypothetical protein [Streptomyces sp. NBC_01433]